MRNFLLTVLVVMGSYFAMAQQKQVIQLSANSAKLELRDVSPESFSAKIDVKEISFESKTNENGSFSLFTAEGMTNPANIGQANLPVISKLIEVPYGAEIQVNIKGYSEEVINLSDYGISIIEPTQPSYSKSTSVEEQFFVIDQEYYNTDELEANPLVKTEIHGIMRGVRIGRVEIRPWRYNPVENTLIVYNNLDFEINFVNADLGLTEEMKNKYFSPEFDGAFSSLLNYSPSAAKDAFSNYAAPLKYVIVANTAFQTTLQPFVQWKTKQGYNVIEKYVASGTTNTSIKTYLQGLYTAGTASDPAPLYVLIIGDHDGNYSIPAFASTASTPSSAHVTDLYFATYDGSSDNIPDLYYGRISANTTTELQNALDKIIPYERYDIPDGSYLNNCMLIAGVDGTYAKSHGDGTLSYGTSEYFNLAHGFSNIYAYYHTLTSGLYNVMSSTNSGASASVKSKITSGVGFANYTAHCDYYGWGDPAVYNQHIADFNNINKYPFMVGNCCLSFQFNHATDAFGEQVIYAKDEGAIGYIGGSNSSYWNEDVYWAIGLTNLSITQANVTNHNYSNTGLGAYDGAWHENGEAYSNWYYSGGQIVQKGNLAVQASSTTYKKYYWEIYHLSGDPSLIPYMTEPSALSLTFTSPMVGEASLTVTTEPYTYVGLSKNNVLLDAQWSGSGTSVTLTPPTSFNGETYCVVGTKQDRSPYINESIIPTAANPPVANFTGAPTTILEGESVAFTDASQYAAEWAWTFGDGGTSTEQNPVHTYTTAGTYTVSLTVTNPLNSDTETKINYITVNINTNPPTTDFVADNTNVSVGATVNFTDLTTNNPETWSWTFDGGIPATSTNQNPSIVYNTPGVYTVSLTATNTYGFVEETKTDYIEVVVEDLIMADGQSTQCSGLFKDPGGDDDYFQIGTDVIEYTHTIYPSTPGAFVRLSFSMLDVEPNGANCYDYITIYNGENTSATEIGTYCGTDYTVIGDAGVVTSSDVSGALTIYFLSDNYTVGAGWEAEISCYTSTTPPTANFTADVTSTCTGIVQFNDLSLIADTWEWDFGDGTSSTEQNPQHTYTANGTYTVSLYVENAYGNDTYSTTNMITVDMPVAPTTTGASACGPASLTLSASGAGTLAWYNAATGGTEVTTGTSYNTTFNNTTTLYVQSEVENLETGYVGPADYSIGTSASLNSTTAHGIYFNAESDFTLVSVVVYSSTTGSKTINLKNSGGTTIATTTVSITNTNTATLATLNFSVPQGTGYQLLGTASNRLYRNSTGGAYPYEIDNIVSIYGNTADDLNYYYFFYNWVIEYDVPCVSTRIPVVATINPLPNDITVSGGGTQCGGSATLTATGGTGGTIYWQNTTSNGTSTTTASSSQTVSASGTYYFRSQSAEGCWGNQGSASATINTPPTAVTVTGGGTQCGGSMILTATGGTGGTIYWQNTTSNGTSTTTASSSQTVSASGTYYFRSQSAEGCWGAEGSATVTINILPGDIAVTGGGTQCGGSATLTATGGTGGTIYWQNTTSNGTSTTTASSSQTVSASGTYYFRSQSAEGCWGNQGSASATINTPPTAVTVTGGGIQCGGSMILTATGGTGGTIYWQNTTSNGTSTTTASPSQTVSASGTYYFRSQSAEGCWGAEGSATVTINILPGDIAVTGGGTQCGGFATLTATGGTGGTIYWQNTTSNGTSTTTASSSQTVSASGTYYFRSQSAEGCWGNQGSESVTINPILDISLAYTDESASGANDGTATVTVNSGTPIYSYSWNVGGTTPTLTGLSGGTYCVTVQDFNSCTVSDCVTVNTLGAAPVANFEANLTNGCDNLTVSFNDLSSNTPTSWAWNFGDGNTSNMENPTHSYTSVGIYTVSLTVTNVNGSNEKIIVDMIIVGETPSITLSMTPESASGNDGTVTVVATGGEVPYFYNWNVAGTGSAFTGLVAGEYCVTVTESNGCQANDCITVTQEEPLAPPVAAFEADLTIGCLSLTVQFTDLSTNSPISWAWDFGDGNTSIEQNPSHTYSVVGLYTVSLNVANGDGSDEISNSDMIFIGSSPVVSVDVVHASGELVADGSVSVLISGGTAPYDILWSNSETGTSVVGLVPGNYSVMVVDAVGCFETRPFIISWVNSITNEIITLSVFPNPAKESVTVEIDGTIATSIIISNVIGQSIISIAPESEITVVNLDNFEAGIYFVKVLVDDKEYSTKLIINQ